MSVYTSKGTSDRPKSDSTQFQLGDQMSLSGAMNRSISSWATASLELSM